MTGEGDAARPDRARGSGAPRLLDVGMTTLAFGLAPLFQKAALAAGTDPPTVALVTVAVAAAFSLALAMRRAPEAIGLMFDRRYAGALLLIGACATGLVALLVSLALVETSATNRSLFQAAYPAATLLFAHVLLGERLRRAEYAWIVLIMLGLFLTNAGDGGVRFGPGFWLLLATLPLIGLGDTLSKRISGPVPPSVLGAGRNIYGALVVVVLAFLLQGPPAASAGSLALLTAAGLCQGVGVWTLYRAFRSGKASLVAGLVASAPLVTVAVEGVLFALVLGPVQWAGVALTVAAAAMLAQAGRRPSTPG